MIEAALPDGGRETLVTSFLDDDGIGDHLDRKGEQVESFVHLRCVEGLVVEAR